MPRKKQPEPSTAPARDPRRHVLLCVAGMTPQVITETLWCLTQDPGLRQPVDEVRVITTLEGRTRVMRELLDEKRGKFRAFCRDYGIAAGSIRFEESGISILALPDGTSLDDIRTRTHNEAAADQIVGIVRELTSDSGIVLHASVAGGRKTMGIFLATAMQLFARVDDRMSHVLVDAELESRPDFFYPPSRAASSRSEARVHLARIPFIRLRGVASDWLSRGATSYVDLVDRAQEDLNLVESEQDLRIDLATRWVSVLGRRARLTRLQHFVFALYALYRIDGRGRDGAMPVTEISVDDVETLARRITIAHGLSDRDGCIEDVHSDYSFVKGILRDIRNRDQKSLGKQFGVTRSKMNTSLENARIPDRYTLRKTDDAFRIDVRPERISIT